MILGSWYSEQNLEHFEYAEQVHNNLFADDTFDGSVGMSEDVRPGKMVGTWEKNLPWSCTCVLQVVVQLQSGTISRMAKDTLLDHRHRQSCSVKNTPTIIE